MTALDDEPELFGFDAWLYEAFAILSLRRNITGAVAGAIPLSEVQAYIEIYHLKDPMFFFQVMQAVDSEYLSIINKR